MESRLMERMMRSKLDFMNFSLTGHPEKTNMIQYTKGKLEKKVASNGTLR